MTNGQVDPTVYANMVATQQKEKVLSAIKDLIDEERTIENVKFQLTGKKQYKVKENGEIKTKEVFYHEPLLNDYGVNKVIADFRANLNPNVVLSYFEKDEIKSWCDTYYTNVIFELARNMVAYDIQTKENHAKIRHILNINFRAVLGRALKGMTILTALKNISVSEIREMPKEKVSLISGVFKR